MMDTDGPGAIVGFFKASTDPAATVRVYLDNFPTPVIEENLRYLLGGGTETDQEKHFPEPRVPSVPRPMRRHFLGGYGTLKPPLAGVQSLGSTLFLPIPYAEHCKVTYDKPGRCYYRINYRTYAPGTPVETFTLAGLKAAAPLIAQVSQTLLHPETAAGEYLLLTARPDTDARSRAAALTVTLNHGPAAVRLLSVKLHAGSLPRHCALPILQITFDGVQTVWCPVGDFFTSGIGLHPSQGWDKSVDADGTMRCFWIMPFKKPVTSNAQPRRAAGCRPRWAVGGTAWAWDARSLYFHANWRQQYPIKTKAGDGTMDWNYIEASGKGVYVGDSLVIHNGDTGWWGEGDEKIYVDGETFPSHFGTGTEDYYGYSRGGRDSAVFRGPLYRPSAGGGG